MTDIYNSRKIKWFEEFTYQLVKNVNHVSFHKERESKLKRYESVNSALVKIFAYRLTYENFGMLNDSITQVAAETASGEMRETLTQLESAAKGVLESPDSDASNLIEIILLLLHEGIDKYLEQDRALEIYLDEDIEPDPLPEEKRQDMVPELYSDVTVKPAPLPEGKRQDMVPELYSDAIVKPAPFPEEKRQDRLEIYSDADIEPGPKEKKQERMSDSDEKIEPDALSEEKKKERPHVRWTTSASEDRLSFRGELLDDFAKHLAEYEQRKAVLSSAKLKEQDLEDFPENKEKPNAESEVTVPLEQVESEVDKSLDMLAMNLGDEGLDDLIFGKASQKDKDAKKKNDEDQWMGWVD